jgi:putative FmdB family regulatory protein
MPTYEYRREDGSTFEIMQRITDPPLERCPTTGQKVKRAIGGGTGLIFKGNGFYLTDYARKNANGASAPKAESQDTAAPSVEKSSKTESSTD